MSARRWAGVTASAKATRAAWCASRVTSPSLPAGEWRAPDAAASAEEITAEWPSIRGE